MRPGRLVAAMVIAALTGGVVYAAGLDGASVPPPAMSDTASTSTATSHPRPVPSTAAAPDPPLLSTAPPWSPDAHTVLSDGLAAWGRFAVTGELETVAPWFSSEGPQWERFTSEAPELAADPLGDPPYRVMVEASDMTGGAGERRVDAGVTFVRTGEPSQTFQWRIVLREEADGWRIWTVEEADSYSSTSSTENP